MKCFHHVDADGYCAAYWAYKDYKTNHSNYVESEDDFIPINYGYDMDKMLSIVEPGEKVYIVDFSFAPDVMKKLVKTTKNIVWIDHHKTAIELYKDYPEFNSIKGIRYDGIAGCVLSWVWYYTAGYHHYETLASVLDPEYIHERCPVGTQLIGDYDVWEYYYGDTTRWFKLGLDSEGLKHPLNDIWNSINTHLVKLRPNDNITNIWEIIGLATSLDLGYSRQVIPQTYIAKGKIIKQYRDSLAAVATQAAFSYTINGKRLFCCNIGDGFVNSEWLAQDERSKDFDAVCNFSYDGAHDYWTYSVYTEKDGVDCAAIVRSIPNTLSAGGHLKAAGAQSKEFIFDNTKVEVLS